MGARECEAAALLRFRLEGAARTPSPFLSSANSFFSPSAEKKFGSSSSLGWTPRISASCSACFSPGAPVTFFDMRRPFLTKCWGACTKQVAKWQGVFEVLLSKSCCLFACSNMKFYIIGVKNVQTCTCGISV